MRDVVIFAVIVGALPFCFKKPYFGVLMWAWIAYFNPHRYAWSSFIYHFPVAAAVAIATILGLVVHGEKLNLNIFKRESVLLVLLWIWSIVTLLAAMQVPLFAGHIDDGTARLYQITKILFMTFVTMLLVNSKPRFRNLVLVIALSFGVRALWSMVFVANTAGESRVWGPHDSFIEDNNDFALALNMILPLLYFSIAGESRRWMRNLLRACFLAAIVCVVLTYSRGGLLGLIVVVFLIAMMTRYRMAALAMFAATGLLVLTFAPQKWMDRMNGMVGMAHGEQNVDESGLQRLIAWRTGWNLAMDHPITGGGLEAYPDVAVFQHYEPEPLPRGRQSEGPHSIYFQMLGEQGFPGLALFLLLLASSLWSLHRLKKQARRISRNHWVIPYTRMFSVSLAAFAISGTFLGRAYFDLWYEIVACVVVLQILYKREPALDRSAVAPEPAFAAQQLSAIEA